MEMLTLGKSERGGIDFVIEQGMELEINFSELQKCKTVKIKVLLVQLSKHEEAY